MIQPNELRVGNLVNYNDPLLGEKHIVRVTGILSNDKAKTVPQIWYENEKIFGTTSNLDCFDPITLTDEILLKCGFADNLPWEINNLKLDSENRLFITEGTGYGVIVARNVIHLHQLQNLYFALIGEELEIEL